MNIEIQIKDKKHSLTDITVRQYYLIKPYLTDNTEKSKISIVSSLLDIEEDAIRSLETYEFLAIWKVVEEKLLFEQHQVAPEELLIDNKVYKFVDIKKLSIGEYSDIEILSLIPDSLHKIAAVLYRPENEPYDADVCQERADLFLEQSIRVINSIISFFLRTSNQSLIDTLAFLETKLTDKEQLKVIKSAHQLLLKSQNLGTDSSSISQETILLELKKLLDSITIQLSSMRHTLKDNQSWLKRKLTNVLNK